MSNQCRGAPPSVDFRGFPPKWQRTRNRQLQTRHRPPSPGPGRAHLRGTTRPCPCSCLAANSSIPFHPREQKSDLAAAQSDKELCFFCCAAHVRNTRAPEAETPKIPTLHSRNAHYTLCSMSCAGPEEEWEFTPEPRGHMCVTNFQEFLLLLSPFAPTHKRAHEWKKNFPYPSDPSLQPRSNDTTARDELGMSAKRQRGWLVVIFCNPSPYVYAEKNKQLLLRMKNWNILIIIKLKIIILIFWEIKNYNSKKYSCGWDLNMIQAKKLVLIT